MACMYCEHCIALQAPEPLDEEWRVIPGFSRYEASSAGRVRSNVAAPRILRAHPTHGRYLSINLRADDGRTLTVRVHRVVAYAFHGLPQDPQLEVAHLNGSNQDNRAANLEWTTRRINATHKVAHGTQKFGEENQFSVLSNSDVLAIVAAVASGETQDSLAERFRVKQTTISNIVRGRSWTSVTGIQKSKATAEEKFAISAKGGKASWAGMSPERQAEIRRSALAARWPKTTGNQEEGA